MTTGRINLVNDIVCILWMYLSYSQDGKRRTTSFIVCVYETTTEDSSM